VKFVLANDRTPRSQSFCALCCPAEAGNRRAWRVSHEGATSYRCAAVAWPLAAGAQQPAIPVINYHGSETPDASIGDLAAVREELKESGDVEGHNMAVEYRWRRT
jgi:hypothetical protein